MRRPSLFAWTLVIAVGAGAPCHAAEAPSYRVLQKWPVPGSGGWDVPAVDPVGRRLYLSHGSQVDVIDLDSHALMGQIVDTPGVHDIAVAPELGRGFTSNGKEDKVSVFDLKTLRVLSKIDVGGKNPDLILYDGPSARVFAFNGKSFDATAIDAASGNVVGRVALGGKPEFAVSDGRGTVYVNLEDKSLLLGFNAKTLTVTSTWPLAPCVEPSPLAIDSKNRLLFAGCGNGVMVGVDATTGRVIASAPIGAHVDGGVFNPATQDLFFSSGEGTLSVIHEDAPTAFRVAETVPTQRGARTIALDTKTNRLYLPTATLGPTPAATAKHPHPRPTILPGTFTVLVVGPS